MGENHIMFAPILNTCKSIINRIKNKIKQLKKPTTPSLAMGTILDLPPSKTDWIVENAILRQQMIVLNRQLKRPQFTAGDRLRFVFLARLTNLWHTALHHFDELFRVEMIIQVLCMLFGDEERKQDTLE
jgi:hypothetical protein